METVLSRSDDDGCVRLWKDNYINNWKCVSRYNFENICILYSWHSIGVTDGTQFLIKAVERIYCGLNLGLLTEDFLFF